MKKVCFVLLLIISQTVYSQKYHDAAAFGLNGPIRYYTQKHSAYKWGFFGITDFYFNKDGSLKELQVPFFRQESIDITRNNSGYITKLIITNRNQYNRLQKDTWHFKYKNNKIYRAIKISELEEYDFSTKKYYNKLDRPWFRTFIYKNGMINEVYFGYVNGYSIDDDIPSSAYLDSSGKIIEPYRIKINKIDDYGNILQYSRTNGELKTNYYYDIKYWDSSNNMNNQNNSSSNFNKNLNVNNKKTPDNKQPELKVSKTNGILSISDILRFPLGVIKCEDVWNTSYAEIWNAVKYYFPKAKKDSNNEISLINGFTYNTSNILISGFVYDVFKTNRIKNYSYLFTFNVNETKENNITLFNTIVNDIKNITDIKTFTDEQLKIFNKRKSLSYIKYSYGFLNKSFFDLNLVDNKIHLSIYSPAESEQDYIKDKYVHLDENPIKLSLEEMLKYPLGIIKCPDIWTSSYLETKNQIKILYPYLKSHENWLSVINAPLFYKNENEGMGCYLKKNKSLDLIDFQRYSWFCDDNSKSKELYNIIKSELRKLGEIKDINNSQLKKYNESAVVYLHKYISYGYINGCLVILDVKYDKDQDYMFIITICSPNYSKTIDSEEDFPVS